MTCGFRFSGDFKMASGAIVLKWCAGSGAKMPSTQKREERCEGALEVEGDREVVRRDVCRADQVQTQGIG